MDLSTTYLGFELPHPIVPGAGPLADDLDAVRRLEDAGAPMIVLRSLFEEQIVGEQLATYHATYDPAEAFPEALTYFPDSAAFHLGPHEYLEHLRRVRRAVAVPVVASLNGTTPGGWLEHASLIEQAGAQALEINVYELASDPHRAGDRVEQDTLDIVAQVKSELSIPVAVKLSPFYTALAHFACRLDQGGVDALVLFNRFYQPDIDIHELEVVPTLELSDSSELRLRLRWLAILSPLVEADLAVTGGIHTPHDAIKAVMCGAHAVQTVSALLKQGPTVITTLRDRLADWLEQNEYHSLRQAHASMSLARTADPGAFERANYMRILQSWVGAPRGDRI